MAADVDPGWQGTLVPPVDGKIYGPREAFRIRLPEMLSPDTVEWLDLELDKINVGKFVSVQGLEIVVTLPQRLTRGQHVLHLVQYTPEQTILERGTWCFEVGGVAAAVQADVTAKVTGRISDSGVPEETLPDAWAGEAGAKLQAAVVSSWSVRGSADLRYTTTPQGEFDNFELGEYLLAAGVGPVTVAQGDQDIAPQSMIMSSFHRRGLAAEYSSGELQQLAVRGFALMTTPTNGSDELLGFNDKENRVNGVTLTAKPLPKYPEKLVLEGTYLEGMESQAPAEGGEQIVGSEGSAWSVALMSSILGGKVQARGEYAATTHVSEPDNPESLEVDDEAWGGTVVARPSFTLGESTPLGIEAGVEYRRVGNDFASLANPGYIAGVQSLKGVLGATLGGFSLQGTLSRDQDNVDDSPSIATTRIDSLLAAAGYRLSAPAPEAGFARRAIGQLVLGAEYSANHMSTIETPADYQGTVNDKRGQEYYVTLGSSYGWGDWGGGYRAGSQKDETGAVGDTESRLADLRLNLRLGSRVRIALSGQSGWSEDLSTQIRLDRSTGRGELSVDIFRDRLSAVAAYQLDKEEADDGSRDASRETIDLNISWTVIRASGLIPGLSLWLRGQWRDDEDQAEGGTSQEVSQVFVGATFGWSPAYPFSGR